MSLWHKTSRGYVDQVDIDGACNVLGRKVGEGAGAEAQPYYMGALLVLNLMRNHDDIRDQGVLMELFDRQLMDNGIQPVAVPTGNQGIA